LDLVNGDVDIYSTPHMYLNLGNFNFQDISETNNIIHGAFSGNLVWVDYDRDGFIDLFQSNAIPYLFKNLGNNTFRLVTLEAGLFNFEFTKSSIWFDYNNDHNPDLLLVNKGYNSLFKNNGDGTFTNVSKISKLRGDKNWKSVAACVGDFNNDQFVDVYIVNIGSKRNALFINNGDGTFTDITIDSGTGDVGDGRTCAVVDYDSDGFVDIFTTNHINPSRLYKNLGNLKFSDVAYLLDIHRPTDIFAATWGDFNGDAIMDVFLNGHIGIALYEGFNTNNSIIVELVGDGLTTNTSAIGSKAFVETSGKKQVREVSGGRGCCEQDMLPLHFGLGEDSEFSLKIRWTNNDVCEFDNLSVKNGLYYKIMQEECDLFSY